MTSRADLRRRIKIGLVTPFCAAAAYALGTSVLLSGIWITQTPLLFGAAAILVFARCLESRLPKLLVLRRFGNESSDMLTRTVIGGISAHFRPLWIHDLSVQSSLRIGLPSLRLYTMRLLIWGCLGYEISTWAWLSPASRTLWISWMVWATASFHRVACGRPAPTWFGSLLGGAAVLAAGKFGSLSLDQLSAYSALGLALLFLIVWFLASHLLYFILPRSPYARWLRRRIIQTPKHVRRFAEELHGWGLRGRFLPTAPAQVLAVLTSPDRWRDAIREAVGASSAVFADVTDIEPGSALAWELEQVRDSGAPLLLTCDSRSKESATSVLRGLRHDCSKLVTWTRDPAGGAKVIVDPDRISEAFYELLQQHLDQDLS